MDVSYRRLVGLVTGWHVAASICFYAVSAATPFFRDEFGLTGLQIGLIITTLMIGYGVLLLPIGVLTDVLGERITLAVGLLGLAVGSILVALAPTYGILLVAVFLLGSMYGTATPGTNKAIFDNIDEAHQHRAIGIKQVGPTIGSAIGAVLVTGLAGVLFWEAGFLVAALIGGVVVAVFYLGYTTVSSGSARGPAFRGLLSNWPFLVLLAAGVFIGGGFYTTIGYTVLFVEEGIGAPVIIAGAILALLQITGSAGRITVGWLADVLPGTPPVRVGGLYTAQVLVGALLFLVLAATTTTLAATLAFALLGFFALGSAGLYFSYLSTVVPHESLGSASAGGQLAAIGGGLFAPPTFGYLVDTMGYGAAWLFLGGLSLIGALLAGVVVLATHR